MSAWVSYAILGGMLLVLLILAVLIFDWFW
jgi:hypothetical protein